MEIDKEGLFVRSQKKKVKMKEEVTNNALEMQENVLAFGIKNIAQEKFHL